MSNKLFWFLAGWLALSMDGAFAGEVRIAFVNTSEVLERAPQAASAKALLQSEFASRDTQLVADQQKLRNQEERLVREGGTLGVEERRRIEREVATMQRELKRTRDEFGEDLNIRRNEEFAKLQREVAKAVVDVARESGYDLVLETGVLYASDRVDITNKVVDRLNKNFSATAGRKKQD